jgi:hypothetical protein
MTELTWRNSAAPDSTQTTGSSTGSDAGLQQELGGALGPAWEALEPST